MALLSDFPRLPLRGEDVLRFYGATETGRSAQDVAKWIADRIER